MAKEQTMTPLWMQWAEKEIGQHEEPENRGPVVRRYIATAKCGEEGEPWCAIFANAAFEGVGIHGTRSPGSQSFRHSVHFNKISGPAFGAVAVFWRVSAGSGLGHVGFYCSETPGYIETLGGNEQDMVRKELLVKAGRQFGLVGYYWPVGEPLPKIGPIAYAGNSQVGNKVT